MVPEFTPSTSESSEATTLESIELLVHSDCESNESARALVEAASLLEPVPASSSQPAYRVFDAVSSVTKQILLEILDSIGCREFGFLVPDQD